MAGLRSNNVGGAGATYRADVQGLRGVSVLLVVLFHAGLGFPGGFVGVDVFFVISGFVIGRGLLREAAETGTVDLPRFYSRRVRRILPALTVMLVTVSLFVALIMAPAFPQPNALKTALAAALSSSNLFLWSEGGGYFSPLEEGNPFVHTWSLGVEEQFYIMFPLLVLLASVIARRSRLLAAHRAFTVMALVAATISFVLSLAWSFGAEPVASLVPNADRFAFYGPVGRVWEFLVGAFLAIRGTPRNTRPGSGIVGVLGLTAIVAASLWLSATSTFPGLAVVLPVIGAALVIGGPSGVCDRLLSVRPLVWLGDRSYSWYLWHWPVIVLLPLAMPDLPAGTVVAAVTSLVPSMLSYRYIEQPFRQGVRPRASDALPSRVRVASPRLALACITLPVGLALVLLQGADRGWGLESHPELTAPSLSQRNFCFDPTTPVSACTFSDGGSAGTILVVGDSHADVISDAVVAAGNAAGYDVIVQSFLSCPFVTAPLDLPQSCRERQLGSLEMIRTIEPEVLVVANYSFGAVASIAGSTEVYEPPDAAALASWESAVGTTLSDVADHTSRVVWYSVVPYFPVELFDEALPTLLRPTGRFPTVDPRQLSRSRQPILDAERRAVQRATVPVVVIDPFERLCSESACELRASDGRFVYRDPHHVSQPFAAELDELFREALADVG